MRSCGSERVFVVLEELPRDGGKCSRAALSGVLWFSCGSRAALVRSERV